MNKNIQYMLIILIIIIIILFVCVILGIIISYYVIKYLKINVLNDIYYSNYGYNKKSIELLKKYGEYKIKNIYLIKNPINKLSILLLNLLTFYGYNTKLNNLNQHLKKKYIPHHISIMIEIKIKNNTKFLCIEKTSNVNISENIHLDNNKIIKKINIENKQISIDHILKETQNRIGDNTFFNWSIYKNNCSIFIKELLITLDLCNNKNMKFINQDNIQYIYFNKLLLHIMYSCCVINNIITHYFYFDIIKLGI